MPKQNDLEQKVLQIILNLGEKGILQSKLWKLIDASSREGSRVALKLEKKGLIRRERELFKGRWTYRLYSKKNPISLESILTCPCLICVEKIRCGAGSEISPTTCNMLTEWILENIEKDKSSSGE